MVVLDHIAFAIYRVEVHTRTVGLQQGEIANDVIGRVGQAEADLDAGTDAESRETLGGAVHQPADFGVAVPPAEKIDASPPAMADDGIVHEGVHGLEGGGATLRHPRRTG